MQTKHEDVEREVRVALVLYGGVSLAVYENGVTRTFHELVRREGIFKIVLGLMRARATVDTIAGTSAGGINGLILGACLESGAEFKSTADMWRDLGDFGRLLRGGNKGDPVESLLDGEGYYHTHLVEAFRGLCKFPDSDYESPGEIDIFITGTDVRGHARRYSDSLGAEISDKEHRVLFRLKHRPGRSWLGLSGPKKQQDDVDRQAEILAAVARITSSFPIAFPPFSTAQINVAARATVSAALESCSRLAEIPRRTFVDGGVLDNKPFGPVLEAIFYRMPTMPVERRLFYVEPDPVPFLERSDADGADGSAAPRETPLGIAAKSLSTIPAHEGISSDLDKLLEHNERIGWLRKLRDTMAKNARGGEQPHATVAQYVQTRVEALCRLLVLETDAAPSARDYPADSGRRHLLETMRATLHTAMASAPLAALDKFDVAFQQRIAFHVLYSLCDALDADMGSAALHRAMGRTGRILKALEVVYAAMIDLREGLVAEALKASPDPDNPWRIVDAFCRLLDAAGNQWQPLVAALAAPAANEPFLDSHMLSEVLEGARSAARTLHFADMGTTPNLAGGTVLDHLMAALGSVVKESGLNGESRELGKWIDLDCALYPIEFASGVHELDAIRFVRISPADAQSGLSRRDPRDKVAGDELAHFSSFLRRDWRSNDLLYGRLDGTCQIIRSLLEDEMLLRAVLRDQALPHDMRASAQMLSRESLQSLLSKASAAARNAVVESWAELDAVTARLVDSAGSDANAFEARRTKVLAAASWQAAAEKFRQALILVGQEDAFESDFEGVLADHYYQEIAYGKLKASVGSAAGSSTTAIQGDAVALAHRDIEQAPAANRERFEAMRLGGQAVTGAEGGVPNLVVGEYVTAVYLLFWGVLRRSLGNRGGLLDVGRINLLFRTPVSVLHYVFAQLRRDRMTAIAAILVLIGFAAGLAWMAFFDGDVFRLGWIIAVVLIAFGLVNALLTTPRWPRLAAAAALAMIVGVVSQDGGAGRCMTESAAPTTRPWQTAVSAAGPCARSENGTGARMIDVELARSPESLVEWLGPNNSPRRQAASWLIDLDFLFIAAYALFFVSAALVVSGSSGALAKIAAGASILGIGFAAGFDILENLRILESLRGTASPLQATAATVKWYAFFASLALISSTLLARTLLFRISGIVGIAASVVGAVGLAVGWHGLIQAAFICALLAPGFPILAWLLLGELPVVPSALATTRPAVPQTAAPDRAQPVQAPDAPGPSTPAVSSRRRRRDAA